LVKDDNIKAAAVLPEVKGDDDDFKMEAGWDLIMKS
jgi:hypothetical protein